MIKKPRKKLYEYVLNIENIDKLSNNSLRWLTTSTNSMILYSILICVLMHFVGIDKTQIGGIVLFYIIMIVFVLMAGLGITLIVIDFKNHVFKHKIYPIIFVTYYLLLTAFMFLSASKRCVYIQDGEKIRFSMDLIIFYSVFLPNLIISTCICYISFINYISKIYRMRRIITKHK